MKSKQIKVMAVTAILMAFNIVLSSFGVPVPGGHMYLNDVIICTAAILLNPFGAFMVGGVGAFIGDLLFYPTPMFVSLVTHGLQAVVISLATRRLGKDRPSGSAIGVTIGAVIMASISRLLVFMELGSTYDNTITGIMLLAIVVVDALVQRRNAEINRRQRLAARTASTVSGRGGNTNE